MQLNGKHVGGARCRSGLTSNPLRSIDTCSRSFLIHQYAIRPHPPILRLRNMTRTELRNLTCTGLRNQAWFKYACPDWRVPVCAAWLALGQQRMDGPVPAFYITTLRHIFSQSNNLAKAKCKLQKCRLSPVKKGNILHGTCVNPYFCLGRFVYRVRVCWTLCGVCIQQRAGLHLNYPPLLRPNTNIRIFK